ncbi:MAG TPA: hypothetical protein VLT59_10500 [Steroidobacteraceae bacterium]|nr:hypothetical protein [Steroidobacteraceae bacterium]
MRSNQPARTSLWFAVCALIGILTGSRAGADEWRNTLTPYLMTPMIEGDIGLLDRSTSIELPIEDVLDSLEIGGMLRYRGENDSMSLNGEVTYMKLNDSDTVTVGPRGGLSFNVDAENEMLVVHADVAWKFLAAQGGLGFAEIYLGVRYTDLSVDVRADYPDPIGPRRAEGSDDFVDPVIGMRSDMPLSDRWTIKVQTDVGGFGVGMELTWIAFGALEYRFSDGLAVWFGYQGLGQDFDDAGDREVLSMDVTYHGPVLGLAMSW